MPDDDLLAYGLPPEWLPDVRQADEHSLLSLADRLPGEAAEALLELATGGKPRVRLRAAVGGPKVHAPERTENVRMSNKPARHSTAEVALTPNVRIPLFRTIQVKP